MAWRNEKDLGAEAFCDICGRSFTIPFAAQRDRLASASFYVNPSLTEEQWLGRTGKDVIYREHACRECRESLVESIKLKIAELQKR